MTILQKQTALLAAAVLLLHPAAVSVPMPDRVRQGSITAFAEQLRTRAKKPDPAQFSELCYDTASGTLLRDGSETGSDFGCFSVQDGALTVQRAAALTQAELDSGMSTEGTVSLAEAAERIGCTYTETDGVISVHAPFQSGTLIVRADGAFDLHGGTEEATDCRGLHVIQYPTPADAFAACNAFSKDSRITFAEPDLIYHIDTACAEQSSDDEHAYGEWGYDAVGCESFKERLNTAENEADPICVAVLDTGIYAEHSWFRNRIAAGACSFVESRSYTDDHMHGTHCAGIIARCTRDNVSILPLKVMDETGYGTSLQVYCGMLYAAEQGADIVSMSLSGDGLSLLLQESVQLLYEKGIPCITSAGNHAQDIQYENPANISNVITVSAVKNAAPGKKDIPMPPSERYTKAAFSNFGDEMDFAAPGEVITSAYLLSPDSTTEDSGTSMAAPFVAACFADLMDYDRSLTPEQICETLRANAVDLGTKGFDPQFGWGMVCLSNLILTDSGCPAPGIAPADGIYKAPFTAEITAEQDNADIRYTLDGSIPDKTNGIRYDGTPVAVTHSAELKAVCLYGDKSSPVTQRTYVIKPDMPEADPPSGAYPEPVSVKLTCPGNSTVYYTLDGSVPDPETAVPYTGEAIRIQETAVLSAVTVTGEAQSTVFRAAYEIGGAHRERLLCISGTTLEACFIKDSSLDLRTLAGEQTITELAPRVFAGIQDLNEITLPDTVTAIGDAAFENCRNLTACTAKGVRKIGASAFSGCKQLTKLETAPLTDIRARAFLLCGMLTFEDADFSQLCSVGAFAFSESGCTGTVALPKLEYLGEYAFSELHGLSLILPDTLTALPEGICMNNADLQLTAKGVTQIGNSAFENNTGEGTIRKLVLPFDRITSVGAYAFAHADLNEAADEQLIFSALTGIGKGAFFHTACRGLGFPKLKVIPSGAFEGIKTELLRFDAAEILCKNAVSPKETLPCCVVFSEQLISIDRNALGDPALYRRIAAPADSAAEEFCLRNQYQTFVRTPYLFVPEHQAALQQNEQVRLTAYPLGTGVQAVWHPADAAPEAPENTDDMLFADLVPDSGKTGTAAWQATLWQNGVLYGTAEQAEVTVFPNRSFADIMETDAPVMLFWDEQFTPEELAMTDGLHAKCTFTAPHAGSFIFYTDSGSTTLRIIQKNRPELLQSGSGSDIDRLRFAELAEGETVTLMLDGSDPQKPCTVSVTEYFPKQSLSDCVLRTSFTVHDAAPDAPLPAVTVTAGDSSAALTEGTDYVLRVHNAQMSGKTEIYAVGIGLYAGTLRQDVIYAEPFDSEQPVTISGQAAYRRFFRFVPEESGRYLVRLAPAEAAQMTLPENLAGLRTSLMLSDRELNEIQSKTAAFPLCECCCELTENEPVFIGAAVSADPQYMPELTVTALNGKRYLGDAEAAVQSAAFTGRETDEPPAAVYTPADTGIPEALTADTDFKWIRLDPLLPGTVRYLLTGTGSFCGSLLTERRLEYSFESASEIKVNTPFSCGGEAAVFRCSPDAFCADPVLVSEDGTPFEAVYYSPDDLKNPGSAAALRADTGAALPVAEGSFLAVRPADGKPHSFVLRAEATRIRLSDAVIEPAECVFTGQPVHPDFRITYQGKELKENRDFALERSSRVVCGDYSVTIYGIGAYAGSAEGTLTVVMPEDEQLPLLPPGEAAVTLAAEERSAMYRWVPENSRCCLMKESLPDALVSLTDSNGMSAGSVSGFGRQNSVFSVRSGESYYVVISRPQDSAGEIRLTITEEKSDFTRCKISGTQQLTLHSSTEPPEITVTDGDRLLTEGQDYTVLLSEHPVQIGYNILIVRGTGAYAGEQTFAYYCIPPFAELPLNGSTEQMQTEQNYKAAADLPGKTKLLRFAAPKDGTYYLELSSFDTNCCTVLLYGDDQSALPVKQRCFRMEAGESLWLAVVTNWPESNYEANENSLIRITQEMPVITFEIDGYEYLTDHDGTVSVMKLPPDQCGYTLPETVTDPETGITGTFFEIFGALTWHGRDIFVGTVTIYGTPGGNVEAFCDENGYCFCALDPDCSVRGDLTGDGQVNEDDILMLHRWLAEGGGMMLPGAAAEAADLNGDGCITLSDLREIMQIAAEV